MFKVPGAVRAPDENIMIKTGELWIKYWFTIHYLSDQMLFLNFRAFCFLDFHL